MERNSRTVRASSDAAADIDVKLDELRALMVRLRRAADGVATGISIQSAESSLARKVAKFSPSGDPAADRAVLADLDRQARSLLNKATRQPRDDGTRRELGTAGTVRSTR